MRRHVDAPTMRQSLVKGKLARFLAGMRNATNRGSGSEQTMNPILAEFVVWAGDFLAGDQAAPDKSRWAGGPGEAKARRRQEEAAWKLLGGRPQQQQGKEAKEEAPVAAAASGGDDGKDSEEEDVCAVCLEELKDASVHVRLGEVLETVCRHQFHAVCYALHMETSQKDPWCPVCRSTELGVHFVKPKPK